VDFDLIIKGGRLVQSSGVTTGDIGIVNGRIGAIGDLGSESAKELLYAQGLCVMAGLIDTQVHFREPGLEHKEDLESGTRAAIVGGVTTVFEMPNTQPNTTDQASLDDKLRRAKGRAWCDYAFFVGASTENAVLLDGLEMAEGTPGVKIFMGSSTGSLLVASDDDLRQVLRHGKRRAPIHAEDEARNLDRRKLISAAPHPREHPFLRDAESARRATERILRLSRETGRPIHILHVSTRDELPLIEAAKREGLNTTAEVTPQHLFFSAPECYDRLGSYAQMNPPIRSAEHREGLWKAVAAGLFDVFGSDHAPHTREEKAKPYPQSPSGMPGVQTMLPVLLRFVHEGKLKLEDIARMACEHPAAIYGIKDRGFLKAGSLANLVLFDPSARFEVNESWLQSKCGWSPYEGESLFGKPEHVLLHGDLAVREGALVGTPRGCPVEFEWK